MRNIKLANTILALVRERNGSSKRDNARISSNDEFAHINTQENCDHFRIILESHEVR